MSTTVKAMPGLESPTEPAIRFAPCPACGYQLAVEFYDGGRQPLSTLAWPHASADARQLRRLPLTFVRCVDCGHLYNADFQYREVPYAEHRNLMFNGGADWRKHLANVGNMLLGWLPEEPTVIEVGCGNGHLLQYLAAARPQGRYLGFDPSPAPSPDHDAIEIHRRLFDPLRDLSSCRPDLIVMRHVLEHLANPLAFLQSMLFAASSHGLEIRLFVEVPAIERALENVRTTDFYYEHNSHFTRKSLSRMLACCRAIVHDMRYAYGHEVLTAYVSLLPRPEPLRYARQAARFRSCAVRNGISMRQAIATLAASGASIAIWGGTGKAAAFINRYGLDSRRFPLVVDSDPAKVGTFVPGTGQEIRFRDYLRDHPVDVVLIATQWRASDIVQEIQDCSIPCARILWEDRGRLVEWSSDR